MQKKWVLLRCQGCTAPDSKFLLEYQKAVLLALEKEGILNSTQLKECIKSIRA